MGAESFTVLAILEARNRASEIITQVNESLGKFGESATKAAETARGAGDAIDESLLKTASGADALDLATARVSATQERAARTAEAQADAERGLLGAYQASSGAADDDVAAQYRLLEAQQKLTATSKENAAAQKELSGAQKLQADTATAAAAKNDEAAVSTTAVKDASDAGGISLGTMGRVAGITALGLGVAGAVMVKAAGNFQDSTTHLVTDAGVAKSNLGLVQAGILNVSTATGQSAENITNAMYHIASSGFTAQNGLNILKIAAEGARVGGADLDTTTKTLVGTMTAYYGASLTAGQATKDSTSLMNQMIETVSRGDMRMQDLASSLSAVTPVAAAAHISFAQVGAAIATMTAQGMSARQATQDLAHTIRSLASPTNVQAVEMRALGLNANQVAKNLGKTGLSGTLDEMRNAVLRNTTGGNVMLNLLKGMTPATQGLANQILAGTITTNGLTTAVKGLNPEQAALISRFKTSATSVTGLQQTFTGAMYKMLGGATGLNVALMLTGKHAGDMAANVKAISAESGKAAGTVDNWSTIQGTFNFKLSQAKTGVENTGIAIGTALLPAVTSVLSAVTKVVIPIAEWTAKNKTLTEVIFVTVTALAAVIAIIAVAKKAFDAVSGAVKTVQATLKALGIISKETADTQAASAKSAAAAQESSSAEASAAMEGDAADVAAANDEAAGESADAYAWMAAKQEASSAEGAAAAEGDAAEMAAANDEAAAGSSASWLASAGSTIAAWAGAAASGIASAARWAAGQAVKAASVVASNVAAAATTAAAWIAAGAQQVAGAAVWVAQTVAKVAVIVASNVAGAAVSMAAWIAANAVMLLGIGLIVLAVIAAVVLIVKNWSRISDAAKTAFDFVVHIAETVFDWVKSHWPLLLAILTGPFGLAAGEIIQHYKVILKAVSDAINWVKSHWPLLLEILTGPVGMAVVWIVNHFAQIRSGAASLVGDLVHFFTTLPSRIISGLGNIGSMLFGAGEKIIQGLINGVESMIGNLGSTMSSIASTITSYLPFSPAKRGPLSGSGSPDKSGRSIARLVGAGMRAGVGDVTSASHLLASSAALGHAGGSGAGSLGLGLSASSGGGGATIVIDVHDNTVMSDSDISKLVGKLGPAVATALAKAGYKFRMQ